MKIIRKKKRIRITEAQLRHIIRELLKQELMRLAHAKEVESIIRVVNVKGTSDDEHPENTITWKEYWEKETGVKLEDVLPKKDGKYLCPGHEHHDKDDGYVEPEKICGCHVKKVNSKGRVIDKTMYITPMCSGCNQRKDIFKIGERALVKRYK